MAEAHGDFAVLLYTWMIPHAEDDGTLPSDPEAIKMRVIPGRYSKTTEEVQAAVDAMVEGGLVIRQNGTIYFPTQAFYRYQTYIPSEKRRASDPISEKRRKTPKNAAYPSPSPSPSPYINLLSESDASDESEFDRFWSEYPRKDGKKNAAKAFAKARKSADMDTIMAGLRRLLPDYKTRERKFVPLASSWLNGERWTDGQEDTSKRSMWDYESDGDRKYREYMEKKAYEAAEVKDQC